MDEDSQDWELRLKEIQRISTNKPLWLFDISSKINTAYKQLRHDISDNPNGWPHFEYCILLHVHYYNIALMYYKLYYSHRINLKIIQASLTKCFTNMKDFDPILNHKDFNFDSHRLKEECDRRDHLLREKCNTIELTSRQGVNLLIEIGETDNVDISNEELSDLKPIVYGIHLINFISEIEEILTLDLDNQHAEKHELYSYLASAYLLCGQQFLYNYYSNTAADQMALWFEGTIVEDNEYNMKMKVENIVHDEVTHHKSNLTQVMSVINEQYSEFMNDLASVYIEREYIKYCIECFLKVIDSSLDTMAQNNNEAYFKKLLTNLDKIQSVDDVPDFFQEEYCLLLKEHSNLISDIQHREFIKTLKLKCWNAILPYVESAQREADLLKKLILYLRSSKDCRSAIADLELQKFCMERITVQDFIQNILNLKESNNKDLLTLQFAAHLLQNHKSLFMIDKFIDILHSYSVIVTPKTITSNNRHIIEVNGKLIIISEIYTQLLQLKTPHIEELHIVGADVVHIDTSLEVLHWSGTNILIVANSIKIHGNITWDISGKHGRDHNSRAMNGVSVGDDGRNGVDGFAGRSGGNMHIVCDDIINADKWTIVSRGGNGSNGQDGGNGVNGKDGKGISRAAFELDFLPAKPTAKIWKSIPSPDVRWDNSKTFRLNFWNSGHTYIAGPTIDEKYLKYSYYAHWCPLRNESYLLYTGSSGKIGGRGGKGGCGGEGGFGGEISVNGERQAKMNIDNAKGQNGNTGIGGSTGKPGKNGWDIGYIFRNGLWSTPDVIGKYEDSKLCLKEYKYRNEESYIYCSYKEHLNSEKCYIEITNASNKHNILNRNTTTVKETKKELYSVAVRSKAISNSTISHHLQNLDASVIDELNDLSTELNDIQERVKEKCSTVDEEKETINVEVRRQAVFVDNRCTFNRNIKRKSNYISQPDDTTRDLIKNIASNASDCSAWMTLKTIAVSYESFEEIFQILYSNKSKLYINYIDIIYLILNKYRSAVCNKISETILAPLDTEIFKLESIENYLMPSTTYPVFVYEDLGTLNEFFHKDDDEDYRTKLMKVAKTMELGSLLYPLKFFIAEKSYKDDSFLNKSETFHAKLNQFEKRLERLAKCYLVSYETNQNSAILQEIERKRKQILENQFSTEECEILEDFYEHIQCRGISSSAVRELLAIIYECNIKIYVRNADGQLIPYHDHNPSSLKILYLEHSNNIYKELIVNEKYASLVRTREYQGNLFSKILRSTDTFYCKKQFDNYLNIVDIYDPEKHPCFYCNGLTANIITAILAYFPNNVQHLVALRLDKLIKYVGKNHILCTMLRRFKSEGINISFQELSYFINTVLQATVDGDMNLSIFEWIITAKSQNKWVNEIFFLQLENHFKRNLTDNSVLQTYVANVKQTEMILLMAVKLSDTHDPVTVDSLEKCLETLNETTADIHLVENLPLSKWQYVMRELLIEHRLQMLIKWKDEELQKALYYLTCLESNVGPVLVNELIRIMKLKNDLTSEILLDIFSYLHNQEWTLSELFLTKLDSCATREMKFLITGSQHLENKERSLETLKNLIENNSHTSVDILKRLNDFEKEIMRKNLTFFFNEYIIRKWSVQFKSKMNILVGDERKQFIKDNISEALNIIIKAVQIKRGFLLRNTQKLAILLLLSHNHNTLAQISTGEGKSLIVVCAAIFKALCGEKVDIITSSSVLAERDASINSDIFDMFEIKVAHNCSEDLDMRKETYSGSQIIYGDLSNYQRDYLLDRFYDKNIVGNRDYDNLIVDEVDSMLLDRGNNTLYLSHDIPGLDKLEYVYLFIWKRVNVSQDCDLQDLEMNIKEAVLYDLYGTLTEQDIADHLNIRNVEATAIHTWLHSNGIIDENNRLLKHFTNTDTNKFPDKYSKYVNKLSYICKKIKSRVIEIRIPKCLYSFVKLHLDLWIKNAVLATIMEEGHDYVVDVDRAACKADINPNITIIDKGTGTDQSSSQWEEGLHQFLQLKHGCKLSAQSLKAVFISNVSYFKKYNRLFGLTGTLGTPIERDLLQELYNVNFVNIPTAMPKKFIEDEPIICITRSEWTSKIVDRTREILDANRSILIICETIRDVDDLQKAFHSTDMRDVLLYKREYEDCTLATGQTCLAGGRIIIATNLAGRGTDIKIDETLNRAGGLHVLLTYLPNNGRIEQQAFGRAARCGSNGSAQLVIIGYGSFLDMRQARDHQELQRISDIKVYYDTRIRLEEQFFDRFAQVYKTLKRKYDNSQVTIIALQRTLDRWAFWLDSNGMQLVDNKTCYSFELFLREIILNFSNCTTWSEDPIQLIKLGLHNVLSKKYSEAVKIFNVVIQNEPGFCEAAHYYKAAALGSMLNFEKRPFKNESAVLFEKFVKELLNAEKLFESHRDACYSASAYVQELKQRIKKSFVQIDAYKSQQEILMNIYDFYIRTIRNILGHMVTNRSFESPEVHSDMTEEIYNGLLSKGVLTKAEVREFKSQDINEISRDYGIPFEILHNFISDSVGNSIDVNDFQTSLKVKLKLPSVEDFWNILLKNNILVNETEFVVVNKTTSDIPDTELQGIEEIFIDMKANEKKRIFKKRVHSDKDSIYIFERGTLMSKLGEKKFETFERKGILTCNALAHVCQERISDPLPAYDQITSKDLLSDDILETEAKEILLILAKAGFLKEISSDLYQLQELYDEYKLVDIPPYTQSIRSVFRYRFAYRIAMENIASKLKESNEPVFVTTYLISEPHMDIMWELINKKIIQPTQVAKHKARQEIAEILYKFPLSKEVKKNMTKSIETVLYTHSGILNTLDVPNLILIPIETCMDELKVSPLQELHTFTLNSLSYILQAEEKKYTLKMIINTSIVTLLGVVQIAAGLIITLASIGVMTHVGSALIDLSDLLYSASAWKTGYFSWAQYGANKLYSLLFSGVIAGIGIVISKGIQLSRFGSKIAMSGTSVAGKDVSTMAGLELIKNTSCKEVGYETGKILIQKTSESIMRGAINMGVDYVVETYLQNFCNELCHGFLEDINESVAQHNVASSLDELYERLGPNASYEKVMFYTNKYFTEPALFSCIISKAQSLIDSVTIGFANAVKKGSTVEGAELLAIIGKVLKYSNYIANLYEIRTSTLSLLDNVNAELRRELQNVSETQNNSSYTRGDIEEFKLDVILQWRNMLTEHAKNVFTNNIIKPILNDCAAVMVNYAKVCCKDVYHFARNKYHVNKFKNKKRKLQKQLEQPVTKEVETKLIKSYHESLLKLRSRIRDPNLYADIVLENGPMDMVCLQACVSVLPEILQKNNIPPRPVKIVYNTDKGLKQEFCSSGIGDPIVINLQVANNHFANIHGNTSSSGDYNCLYQSLLTDIPELAGITADVFRNKVSEAIRTDESVHSIIKQGYHQYTISQGVHGGYVDRKITTYDLHDDLMNANSALSQSSVSEYTSTRNDVEGIHLSKLANDIRNEGFEGNPINAVQNECGGLIFLDNRRTVAASTINNRNVSVHVRVFGKNEVLPTDLQNQYGGKTAGEAANTRIKRSGSIPHLSSVNSGYHPHEVRIRPDYCRNTNSQFSTEQSEFFKRSGNMGYLKYRRGSK